MSKAEGSDGKPIGWLAKEDSIDFNDTNQNPIKSYLSTKKPCCFQLLIIQSQKGFHCTAARLMHAGVQWRCCICPCEILPTFLFLTWNWAANMWWFFFTHQTPHIMFMIFLLSISDPPTNHPTNQGEFQISTDQGNVFMSSSPIGTCRKCNFKFNPPQAMSCGSRRLLPNHYVLCSHHI